MAKYLFKVLDFSLSLKMTILELFRFTRKLIHPLKSQNSALNSATPHNKPHKLPKNSVPQKNFLHKSPKKFNKFQKIYKKFEFMQKFNNFLSFIRYNQNSKNFF